MPCALVAAARVVSQAPPVSTAAYRLLRRVGCWNTPADHKVNLSHEVGTRGMRKVADMSSHDMSPYVKRRA